MSLAIQPAGGEASLRVASAQRLQAPPQSYPHIGGANGNQNELRACGLARVAFIYSGGTYAARGKNSRNPSIASSGATIPAENCGPYRNEPRDGRQDRTGKTARLRCAATLAPCRRLAGARPDRALPHVRSESVSPLPGLPSGVHGSRKEDSRGPADCTVGLALRLLGAASKNVPCRYGGTMRLAACLPCGQFLQSD